DLWVVSVHLLSTSSAERALQAGELRTHIQTRVPAGDFVVVGGDFNTGGRNETCINTLSGVLRTGAPYPADQANNSNTNATRAQPYDWVLASPGLDSPAVPVVIGGNAFDAGLVFDTRVYSPLSDVAPALQTDSAAPNMQHMAVVRDFSL